MKQLFTTKYVSFMAIGLMAAMSLGSCSNDDEPNVPPTGTTLAKITMGVTGLPQTKQSANDVNQDGTPKDIPSIVLVPMVGNTWQNAIDLGSFDISAAAHSGTNYTQTYNAVAINRGVNKFRVYGGEAAKVAAPITAATKFQLGGSSTVGTTTVYEPAGLYYYVETEEASSTGTQKVTIEGPESARQDAVAENTEHIAITGVRYGVGLLTTRVSVDPDVVYVDATGAVANPVTTADFTGTLTLEGVFVGSQPEMVDAQFDPMDAAGKTRIVKDEDIASPQITENTDASQVAVNNYTTLFQTMPGEEASVVLKLTSDVDIWAKDSENGTTYTKVAAGTAFYVKAVLAPNNAEPGTGGTQTCLFQKYYETKANLKINSLANATTDLPDITPTDVNLDVTVDVSWVAGFMFNETID